MGNPWVSVCKYSYLFPPSRLATKCFVAWSSARKKRNWLLDITIVGNAFVRWKSKRAEIPASLSILKDCHQNALGMLIKYFCYCLETTVFKSYVTRWKRKESSVIFPSVSRCFVRPDWWLIYILIFTVLIFCFFLLCFFVSFLSLREARIERLVSKMPVTFLWFCLMVR